MILKAFKGNLIYFRVVNAAAGSSEHFMLKSAHRLRFGH